MLRTPGGGDLLQTIAAVYGTAAARSMLQVQAEEMPTSRSSGLDRGKTGAYACNRYGMTTIVNGRYVRSYALQTAIVQAYHTLLPINRYPLVVLQLTMDPSLVDVNVHPAKLEVRFSKERELMKFIEAELGRVLRGADLIRVCADIRSAKPSSRSSSSSKTAFQHETLESSRRTSWKAAG